MPLTTGKGLRGSASKFVKLSASRVMENLYLI